MAEKANKQQKVVRIKLQAQEPRDIIVAENEFDFVKDYKDVILGEKTDKNGNPFYDIFIGERSFKTIYIEELEVLTMEEAGLTEGL